MRILGLDPSTSGAAYAVLDYDPISGQFTLVESGELPAVTSYRQASTLLGDLHATTGFTVAALETPAPFVGSAAKFPHLIAMTLVLGALASGVPSGVPTYLLPANPRGRVLTGGWRPFMLGIKQPVTGQTWDQAVAAHYQSRAPLDWPKRSNNHVRDAGMIGMALARALLAGDLALTGAALGMYGAHKVVEQRAQEARKRNKDKVPDPTKVVKRSRKRRAR